MCIRDRERKEDNQSLKEEIKSSKEETNKKIEELKKDIQSTKEELTGTVSYTHLDVYKRQPPYSLIGLCNNKSFFFNFINITFVSYTHLDVYKRQIVT